MREICPIWLQNLPRQHLHVHAPLSMCLSLSSPSPPSLSLSLSWKFLSSRCGTALKPLFLAAQPSAGRPQDLPSLPLAAAAPELSERVTKLEFQKHSWASALWAGRSLGQPARWGGRDKRGEGRWRKEEEGRKGNGR